MTTSDESERAVNQSDSEQATARIIELLEKLAAAEEGLSGAAAATGFSVDQAQASLRQAAQILRKNRASPTGKQRFPLLGSILDWHEMTVAEALEILGEYASRETPPKADAPATEGP
jgi:hypothetical protein